MPDPWNHLDTNPYEILKRLIEQCQPSLDSAAGFACGDEDYGLYDVLTRADSAYRDALELCEQGIQAWERWRDEMLAEEEAN